MTLNLLFNNVKEISPYILKHNLPSAIYKELTKCVKHTNKIKKNNIKPPTNIIIGRVVDLSDTIGWKK